MVAKTTTRSNKPIMEKRRRARINHCLNQLKALILDSMNKDTSSKLEKADILELTVRELESLKPVAEDSWKAGWRECSARIQTFPGLDSMVKERLMDHLTSEGERGRSPCPNQPSDSLQCRPLTWHKLDHPSVDSLQSCRPATCHKADHTPIGDSLQTCRPATWHKADHTPIGDSLQTCRPATWHKADLTPIGDSMQTCRPMTWHKTDHTSIGDSLQTCRPMTWHKADHTERLVNTLPSMPLVSSTAEKSHPWRPW